MKIKALIQGQTISIDNHKRGDRSEIRWDKEFHLHKIFNNDRYNGAHVLIPLNPEKEMVFRMRGTDQQKVRIISEVQKAFKDKNKRKEFLNDVLEQILRFSEKERWEEKIFNLLYGIEAIVKHFGFKSTYLEEVNFVGLDKIDEVLTKHRDETFNEYYTLQKVNENRIIIGENLEIIREWKDIMKRFDSNP